MTRTAVSNTILVFTLSIILTAGLASAAGEVWEVVSITATVQDVDPIKRQLTLKGPQGNVRTFTVDERVKRLHEVKPGDKVEVDYYVSLAMELREPTTEESRKPLTVTQGTAEAPPGTAPAAGGLRRIKAVVTVTDIDRPSKMVTLKGPLGNTLPVLVSDPARLKAVRKGDKVIVTYTEALAVSVKTIY